MIENKTVKMSSEIEAPPEVHNQIFNGRSQNRSNIISLHQQLPDQRSNHNQITKIFLSTIALVAAFFCVTYGIPIQEIVGTAALIYFFIASDTFLDSQATRAANRVLPQRIY